MGLKIGPTLPNYLCHTGSLLLHIIITNYYYKSIMLCSALQHKTISDMPLYLKLIILYVYMYIHVQFEKP